MHEGSCVLLLNACKENTQRLIVCAASRIVGDRQPEKCGREPFWNGGKIEGRGVARRYSLFAIRSSPFAIAHGSPLLDRERPHGAGV